MKKIIEEIMEEDALPQRVGTTIGKNISAGAREYRSNSFEAFLPKGWEKSALQGYNVLVGMGLRPPLEVDKSGNEVFPPRLELYKEWEAAKQSVVTDATHGDPVVTERGDQSKQAKYRAKHREELAQKERARRAGEE